MVYQPLLDAKKEGRIAELRAFGRSFDDEYKQELEKAGFKTHLVDYSDEKTLLAALKGVNCLLSCMGAQGDFNESKHALLEAAIKSKVQVYIPSEFGTDHNALKEHGDFPMFAKKRKHFKESQAAGIKTVGIFTSLILEYTFFKRSGFDNEKEQWTVCGKANGAKVSLSSEIDVGKYTVEALLLAYNDPEKCPEHVRIYSTNMTMQDYADGFDAVAGRKTTITETSLDDAVATYIRLRPTLPSFQVGPLIPVMLASCVYPPAYSELTLTMPCSWRL